MNYKIKRKSWRRLAASLLAGLCLLTGTAGAALAAQAAGAAVTQAASGDATTATRRQPRLPLTARRWPRRKRPHLNK